MTYSIIGTPLNILRKGREKNEDFTPAWLNKLKPETRDLLLETLNKRKSGLGGLNNTQRREVAQAILNSHIEKHGNTATWRHGPNAGKLITSRELDRLNFQVTAELSRESAADNREWLTNIFVKLGGALNEVGNFVNDISTYARDSDGKLIPNTSRTDFLKTGEYREHLERQAAKEIGRNVAEAGRLALENRDADRNLVNDLQINPPPKENNTGNGANGNGQTPSEEVNETDSGNSQSTEEDQNLNGVNNNPNLAEIGDMNEVNRAEERKAATTPWVRGQGDLGTRNDKTIAFWNQKYKLDNVPKHDRDNLARALRTGEAWETGHGTVLHTDEFGITHVYRQRG